MRPNSKGVVHAELADGTRVSCKLETGRVHCTCADFQERCDAHKPTTANGPKCMHVAARLPEFAKAVVAFHQERRLAGMFTEDGRFKKGYAWHGKATAA